MGGVLGFTIRFAKFQNRIELLYPPKGPYLAKGYFSLFLSVFFQGTIMASLASCGKKRNNLKRRTLDNRTFQGK